MSTHHHQPGEYCDELHCYEHGGCVHQEMKRARAEEDKEQAAKKAAIPKIRGRHLYLVLDNIQLSDLPKEHVFVGSRACVRLSFTAEPGWGYESRYMDGAPSLMYDLSMPFLIGGYDSDSKIIVDIVEDHGFHFEKTLARIEFKSSEVCSRLDPKGAAISIGHVPWEGAPPGTFQANFHTELWDPVYTKFSGDESSIDKTQDLWTTTVVGAVKMQLDAATIVDPASLPLPPDPHVLKKTKPQGMNVIVATTDPHLKLPPGSGSLLTLLNKLPFDDEPGVFPSRKVGLSWLAKHTHDLWPNPKEGLWPDVTTDENFTQYCFCNAGTEFVERKADGTYLVDLDVALLDYQTRPTWEPYNGKAYFDTTGKPTHIELKISGVANTVTFRPGDEDWEYAKLRIRSGLFIWASGVHLCRGHLRWANEPQIGTRECLSSIHPINRLLAPHFFRSALVIAKSLSSLTPERGMLHRSTAFTASELARFFQAAYDRFEFKPWYETAKDRGWDEKNCDDSLYPALRDSKDLNDIIHNWVRQYVQLYYPDDATVAKDGELAKYWAYMTSVWSTLPKQLTQQTLTDFCSNVIFYNSAWHEQIGNVSGYARDPAALALLIRRGERPVLGVPQSNILIAYITIMTQEKTPRLNGDWTHYFLDTRAKELYRQFHIALGRLSNEIEERNKTRRFVLRDYNPDYVKLSISS